MDQVTAASSQPNSLSRQSSDIDYAVAEQLIQHSQRARHNSEFDSQDSGRGHFPNLDNLEHPNGTQGHKVGQPALEPHHKRQSSPQSISQENLSNESPYGPMSNPPALGQRCRLVILNPSLSLKHVSWQSIWLTYKYIRVATVRPLKLLFGGGHLLAPLSAMLVDCILKPGMRLVRPI